MAKMNYADLNAALTGVRARWTAAENEISVLEEPARKALLGAVKPYGYQPPAETPRFSLAAAAPLPVSVDWRNNAGNHVSSVKNQGGCGTCVGFGITGVLESMISIEHSMLLNISPADAFFCSSHGANCSGWWPLPAFQANQGRGICQEYLFPYASAFPGGNIWAQPPSCMVSPQRGDNLFNYVNINTVTTVAAAKNYLATTGPLTACFDVYEDFFSYHSGIYHHVSGPYEGGHCIEVVGYDDSPGAGYWICKNSWGTSWGMNGYFFIAYGECNIDVNEKNGVSSTTLPNKVYASIGSNAFSNVYLRMDGTGVTQPTGPGGGVVNCQYTAGPYEFFTLNRQPSGHYTIGSVQFANVYLRMDGSGVTQPSGPGGGVVNCEYTAGPWEQFNLMRQPDGTISIGSVQFPNVYLRMDGSGVTQPTGPGGGVVNCQYTAGPWEQFLIINL